MCNLKDKQILWRCKSPEYLPVSMQSRHRFLQEAINFYKDETNQSEKYLKMGKHLILLLHGGLTWTLTDMYLSECG